MLTFRQLWEIPFKLQAVTVSPNCMEGNLKKRNSHLLLAKRNPRRKHIEGNFEQFKGLALQKELDTRVNVCENWRGGSATKKQVFIGFDGVGARQTFYIHVGIPFPPKALVHVSLSGKDPMKESVVYVLMTA